MIDFGLTQNVASLVYGSTGTIDYVPMEVRHSAASPNPAEDTYDPSMVDVFNMGVMLFMLTFG